MTSPSSPAAVRRVDAFRNGKHWLARGRNQCCGQLLKISYRRRGPVWSLQHNSGECNVRAGDLRAHGPFNAAAGYTIFEECGSSCLSFRNQGGHSISGTAQLEHPLGEHLKASLGYQRLHQSYSGIAAIIGDPDSDRVSISISYQFTRPLGR